MATVTIQRAAVLALKTYLAAELSGSSVTVMGHWPSGQTLPAKCVSIVPAGAVQYLWATPRVVRSTIIDADTKSYVWRMRVVDQPIQIDVWVSGAQAYPIMRDELLQLVDVALHQGLGNANSLNQGEGYADPFRDGVLLNLDPTLGHTGTVDVVLLSGPAENDTPDAAQRKEWRATIRAELRTDLEFTATQKRLKQTILQMKIGEGALGTAPNMNYTFDATS